MLLRRTSQGPKTNFKRLFTRAEQPQGRHPFEVGTDGSRVLPKEPTTNHLTSTAIRSAWRPHGGYE